MSSRLGVVLVSCLMLFGGCSGLVDSAADRPTTTTERPSTTESLSSTKTTTTASTTTTISYTEEIENELRISNFRNQSRTVAVTITAGNGTVVFEDELSVESDGSRAVNISYPATGTYVVTAAVGNESGAHTYEIQSTDPGTRIGVVLLDDGIQIDEEAV